MVVYIPPKYFELQTFNISLLCIYCVPRSYCVLASIRKHNM